MPVATIEGVRIPDPAMVELVLAAQAQGFRFEPGTGGGHAEQTGFTLYPPDKAHGPIRAGCTEVSPNHVRNVRRSLIRAGFDPNPTVIDLTDDAPEVPVSTRSRKSAAVRMPAPADALGPAPASFGHTISSHFAGMSDDERTEFAMGVTSQVVEQSGMSADTAKLAGMLVATLGIYDRQREDVVCSREELDEAKREAIAALRLAEEQEQACRKATQRAEKAEAKGAETGRLLTEAQERLREVEAERDEMKRALDPLRALLGKTA